MAFNEEYFEKKNYWLDGNHSKLVKNIFLKPLKMINNNNNNKHIGYALFFSFSNKTI